MKSKSNYDQNRGDSKKLEKKFGREIKRETNFEPSDAVS